MFLHPQQHFNLPPLQEGAQSFATRILTKLLGTFLDLLKAFMLVVFLKLIPRHGG